jgi:aspartate ammonia-lyase
MGTETRIERDGLGERSLPAEALWGIHTLRALENFPLSGRPVHRRLVAAFGAVKLAALHINLKLGLVAPDAAGALEQACREMMAGGLDAQVVVDALQGGAGTSTNLNVDEVLANRALQLLGEAPGTYHRIDPLREVNRNQSTNDTYPTALRVAALGGLARLERELVVLQEACQGAERRFAGVVKVGRTQLQDAVLITLGRECGAWAEAFGRDRWRVSQVHERLRVVNLGGGAIGTGATIPRSFIFQVVDGLRAVTGLNLVRAENLVDATQNHDSLVEASGILKACAINLIKIGSDLRLLASGPRTGFRELRLPAVQTGSSMMPGKINPVIPEAVCQAGMRVVANDLAITQAGAAGQLELNAFLPLVAEALLESLDLLAGAADILARRCLAGLEADAEVCGLHLADGTPALTALIGSVGYATAEAIAATASREGISVRAAALRHGVAAADFDARISPAAVNRLGEPAEGG